MHCCELHSRSVARSLCQRAEGAQVIGSERNLVLQVTISLLEEAMLKGGKQQVLIDGFPRNEENRAAFEAQVPALLASNLGSSQAGPSSGGYHWRVLDLRDWLTPSLWQGEWHCMSAC